MKNKNRVRYLHTIDGCPATYFRGEQICYVNGRTRAKLVSTLQLIKKHQRLSNLWRTSQGFEVCADYGYIRVVA